MTAMIVLLVWLLCSYGLVLWSLYMDKKHNNIPMKEGLPLLVLAPLVAPAVLAWLVSRWIP
jgi:hypothetical protein